MVKNLPANAGEAGNSGSIPGSGRSPGGGNGNPFQYSCLINPMAEGPGGRQSLGPEDLPAPGTEPHLLSLLHWQVDFLPLRYLGSPLCANYNGFFAYIKYSR